MKEHLSECDFGVIKCPNKGCGDLIIRKNLYEHQAKCIFGISECDSIGCHVSFKGKDFAEPTQHQISCKFQKHNLEDCKMS